MKNIEGRLNKLERRLGISADRYLFIFTDRDMGPASDHYIKILEEGGFLPTSGVADINFSLIPRGLNAKDTERFVRENGARICGPSCAQSPSTGISSAAEGTEPIDGGIRINVEIS
jgi:hypothetical protein